MKDYKTITVEKRKRITSITLNRPEVLNAINPEMHCELQRAFDDFAGDNSQWVGVVRGSGRAFSAGSDLKAIARNDGVREPYPENGYAGIAQRFDLTKPIIAAVDGVAVGGGFEVALACDIIIATKQSKFGLPEPLVGAVALGGGVHRLARQIGLKQAMFLVLTGQTVDAETAFSYGIVSQIVENDGLNEAIERCCSNILKCAPLSVRASKEAMSLGLNELSLRDALVNQESYPTFRKMQESDDRKEGPKSFTEKRAPKWSAR